MTNPALLTACELSYEVEKLKARAEHRGDVLVVSPTLLSTSPVPLSVLLDLGWTWSAFGVDLELAQGRPQW